MEQKKEASQAVGERAAFEKAMNEMRSLPRELDFSMTKSPSGRPEYANTHLESCWNGWQARAALKAQPAHDHQELTTTGIDRQIAPDLNIKAQPAPTEAARDRIPMPTNADQAELMQKLGLAWLQTNAPDRLTDAGRAAQGEDSARLDAVRIEVDAAAFEAEICDAPNRIITDKTPWGWRYRRAAMQDKFMEFRARASTETGGVKP